jgi:hypothetical protein
MRLRAGLATVLILTGCTATTAPRDNAPAGPRLAAFGSCAELTTALRAAAKASVTANGLRFPVPDIGRPPLFSSAGPDQPDVVRTDGRRVVSLAPDGTLRVVDAAGRRAAGSVITGARGQGDLLISGDRALVLSQGPFPATSPAIKPGEAPPPRRYAATELVLVDISGAPRVLTRLRTSGTLLDARQTGDVARIVLSHPAFLDARPRIGARDDERLAAYRKAIDTAGADAWLPEWTTLTEEGNQVVIGKGKVPCEAVTHPPAFSGRSVVTALTIPLSAPKLDSVPPVAVVGESATALSTPTGLYLPVVARGPDAKIGSTDLFRFDVRGAEPPVFRAGATVPGVAGEMSEWEGHLRVVAGDQPTGQTALHVLRADDLRPVGVLDRLGVRVAIRFAGPLAHSMSTPARLFDLRQPSSPRPAGSLTVDGTSAVLRATGPGRLVAVGPEAVTLYDVSDPATPRQLARHPIKGYRYDDSRAILWHPSTNLLVVPTEDRAVGLRVTGDTLTAAGEIRPPGFSPRTLVVGDELWNPYAGGWQVSRLSTMEPVTTVRF